MENAIEINGGVIRYRDFQLGPLNVKIKKGYITALIGRNGSGKTSLLKGMAHLQHLDEGAVLINNQKLDEIDRNTTVSYVSDKLNMYSDFSCAQAIQFVSSFYNQWDRQLEIKLIDLFEIPLKKMVHELSLGMKVKLNLLLSICFHPQILLLDEPTSGLDPIVRKEFLELIQEFIEEEERTVCISSHITTDIEQICDYLIFLKDGKVALEGEKYELLNSYTFISAPPSFTQLKEVLVGYEQSQTSLIGIAPKGKVIENSSLQMEAPTIDHLLQFVVEGGKSDDVKTSS